MAGEIALAFTRRFASGVDVHASLEQTIPPGSILVVFGPSGAGKTTVLRAIAGLIRPDRGRIVFEGSVWFDSDRAWSLAPQKRRVGYVAQNTALFPHLSVRANIEYGLRTAAPAERRRRTDGAVALVRARDLEGRFPRQLSGGEAQRVALARALAPLPALMLLDEPFGALDAVTRRELRAELRAALRDTGTSAILVTHDRFEAMAMGDAVAVMVAGEIRQVGAVPDVFRRPADLAVARSLGVETVLPATVESGDDGLIGLRVGEARLVAVADADCGSGDEVFACVRAEDVIVERERSVSGSARNHLPGVVVAIEPEGAIERVTVDCGFVIVAAITRRSREDLALVRGSAVTVAVKATAVHVVPKA